MAYKVENNTERNKNRTEVTVKTKKTNKTSPESYNWWRAKSKAELCQQVIETASFLKEQQQYRYRQATIS